MEQILTRKMASVKRVALVLSDRHWKIFDFINIYSIGDIVLWEMDKSYLSNSGCPSYLLKQGQCFLLKALVKRKLFIFSIT